ncbi:TPM domain-containing protein [Phytoactinopolyspora limicola]|uniref:TPM domain-containing protein n=1 Tax=Phytoactinopolyspora limicola TaxID=2715536 RepID=UPI0014088B89|nr:TPM domain-containing protein [Phytoactinopolyspora limicola]
MRSLVRSFVASVLAAPISLVVVGVFVVPAAAQTPVGEACDAILVDHAGQLSAGEAAEVERAARSFRSDLSYEVRIRVLTQEQAPFLETWVDAEEQACRSWQGPDGGFRGNLVVLSLTTDTADETGETLIAYGDRMPDAMDDIWPRIQADTINPALNDGAWARGIVEGLSDIRDVIDPQEDVSVAGVVIAATGAAGIGGGVVYVRRRRRKQLADRLHRSAAELDTLTLRLDPLTETLRRDIELVRTAIADDEVAAAVGESGQMLDTADQLVYQRSELSADRDLLTKRRSLAQVTHGVQEWEALEASVRDLIPRLEGEQTRLAAILAVGQEAPGRLNHIAELKSQVERAREQAQADGYVTTTDAAVLDIVDEKVAVVGRLLAERRLLAVDAETTKTIAGLETARESLTRLAEREASLRRQLDELDQAQADVAGLDATAANAEETLRAEFAQSVVEPVAGRVEAGQDGIERAAASIAAARDALGIRDLGAAERCRGDATTAQGSARSALTSVVDQLELARELRQSVPERHRAAANAVAILRDVVTKLGRAATTQLQQQASELAVRVEAVNLQVERPDWIALDQELQAIAADAEKATAEAEKIRHQEEQRRHREADRRHRQYSRSFGSSTGSRRRSSSRGGSSRGGSSRGGSSRGGSSRRSSGGSRRGGSSRR